MFGKKEEKTFVHDTGMKSQQGAFVSGSSASGQVQEGSFQQGQQQQSSLLGQQGVQQQQEFLETGRVLAAGTEASTLRTQVQQGVGSIVKEQMPTTKKVIVEERYQGQPIMKENVVPGTVNQYETVIPGDTKVYEKSSLPQGGLVRQAAACDVNLEGQKLVGSRILAESTGPTVIRTTETVAPTRIVQTAEAPEKVVLREAEIPIQGNVQQMPVQGQSFETAAPIPAQTEVFSATCEKPARVEQPLQQPQMQAQTGANVHSIQGELSSQRHF